MRILRSHPRYESLKQRHLLVDGVKKGYVADSGLIAHGRGEAFDYLIGEKTLKQARCAEEAAVALMLLSERPVVSVNGNTAALVPKEIVELARSLSAGIEVNLFYRTPKRERLIERILKKNGAGEVLGVGRKASAKIPLKSERGKVDPRGISSSDAVLVPLEDGDRVEALISMGKKVVSVDLNPLSRTSQKATVSIVDNVVRAIPNMIELAGEMKGWKRKDLMGVYGSFDNRKNLDEIVRIMRRGLI